MRNQYKHAALFLLAAALVVGCADEPDEESIGSIEDAPIKSEPKAEQSADTAEEEVTFGASDKALRDDYCCVLKRNGASYACSTYYSVTGLVARYKCASSAIGTFYDGHALRDGRCSRYSDC